MIWKSMEEHGIIPLCKHLNSILPLITSMGLPMDAGGSVNPWRGVANSCTTYPTITSGVDPQYKPISQCGHLPGSTCGFKYQSFNCSETYAENVSSQERIFSSRISEPAGPRVSLDYRPYSSYKRSRMGNYALARRFCFPLDQGPTNADPCSL
jgi:hypothetical protein